MHLPLNDISKKTSRKGKRPNPFTMLLFKITLIIKCMPVITAKGL